MIYNIYITYISGIFFLTVKNFEVKINPSNEINKNVENVKRFIDEGCSLQKNIN